MAFLIPSTVVCAVAFLLTSLTYAAVLDSRSKSSLLGNSSVCDHAPRWFTQNVDHFGQTGATFQQKYYLADEFYKPSGPILMFHGEESTKLDCVDSSIMYKFAQELGGLAVNLEHRYFGESLPAGPDWASYKPEDYKHLTLDNVMMDAKTFVESIKKNLTGAQDAPVFVASGSYGGFLVTMIRQNHPETFDGVLASSAPLRLSNGPIATSLSNEFGWWNYVNRIYLEKSAEAAFKVGEAFSALKLRFLKNDTSTLQQELGLCAPVEPSLEYFVILETFLREVFTYAAEFNYPKAEPGRSPIDLPLDAYVSIAIEEKDPIKLLKRTNWMWYEKNAELLGFPLKCLDLSAYETTTLGVPLIATAPFAYLTCKYTPAPASLIPNGTIFPPSSAVRAQLQGVDDLCMQEWGVRPPTSQELEQKYHFTTSELRKSTGIIWYLGDTDPTTGVSGYFDFALPDTSNPFASRRIFAKGAAHREDLFMPDENTRQVVREVQDAELEIIKTWIGLLESNSTRRHTF